MLIWFCKRWKYKEDGTTAIEFSLLVLPFFMLLVGIIEISLMFTSATLLENATSAASRMIRTGQIQQSSDDPQTLFRNEICDHTMAFVPCNDVVFEVQQLSSFSDFGAIAPTFDSDGNLVSSGFDTGGSSDRVLIRVAYTYEMMTPFIGPLLAGSDNSILFMSTVVLQTEPYDFGGGAS